MAYKVITVDDFSGGKNTYDNQLLLKDNQCATGSYNVWEVNGVLTKTPGVAIYSALTATGGTGLRLYWLYSDEIISSAYSLYYRMDMGSPFNGQYLWAGLGTSESLSPLGYTTGTVSVSGATLISATGNGTSWSSHVSAGDRFRIDASASSWYNIASVEDDTHLTLSSALPTAVATGAAYTAQLGFDYVESDGVSFNDKIFMSTIGNYPQIYDGTGLIRVTSAPKAMFVEVFKNYVFTARQSVNKSRVQWSALQDPTSWPASNFIDVDKGRGNITGLRAFGNELIVFKTFGMFKIVGDIFDPSNPTYAVYPISVPEYFRFNSNYSAVIHRGELWFYSFGNIYRYRQGTNSIELISKIFDRDLPDTFGDTGSTSAEVRVRAVSFNDLYIIKGLVKPSSWSGTGNDVAGIIDEKGAWWVVNNINETTTTSPFGYVPMVVLLSTTAKPKLLTGTETNVHLYDWDFYPPTYEDQYYNTPSSGAPTALAINSTWISKEFNIEYGLFKSIVLYLGKQSAGSLTLSWSIDQGSFIDNTVDMSTGRGGLIRKVLDINQKGSTIQIKVNNNTVDQVFKVLGIKILYEPILEDRKV